MKLKKLPSRCIAPLRLKEITLHGIGSYYKHARLQIKPLTILCGANGAGKSTWMKVLSALKDAVKAPEDENDKVVNERFFDRLNNAVNDRFLVNTALTEGENNISQDDGGDTYCGPFGSFSVTFTCVKPIKLTEFDLSRNSSGQTSVLKISELKRGDTVRLRFTQYKCRKTPNSDYTQMGGRFSVNGNYLEALVHQENSETVIGLHEGSESDVTETNLNVCDKTRKPIEQTPELCEALEQRLKDIVAKFAAGFFPISAIRNIVKSSEKGTESAKDYDTTAQKFGKGRYVGENGEHTNFFRHYFSATPVFDPRAGLSYCGTDSPDALTELIEDYAEKALFPPYSFLSRYWVLFNYPVYWQYLYDDHRHMLLDFGEFLKSLPADVTQDEDVQQFLMDFCHAMQTGDFHGIGDHIPSECVVITRQLRPLGLLLIDILFKRPDYFRWFLQKVDRGDFSLFDEDLWTSENSLFWAKYLASFPDNEIHPDDILTLNRWAWSWSWCDGPGEYELPVLRVGSLFGWWADRLLNVTTHVRSYSGRQYLHEFVGRRPKPVGYLSSLTPTEFQMSYSIADATECPFINRFLQQDRLWELSYAPGYFSAGLHQVAPILVQMNMMLMNEVIAVENPEVHLHPGLQLRFMEFFIENALIGKFSLVETHSDLMIRRVMRAITEEKLPQSWVDILFVDAEPVDEKGDIWTSKIERLKLNDRGEISNWPEGFLDDDEKETEALFMAKFDKDKGIDDAE